MSRCGERILRRVFRGQARLTLWRSIAKVAIFYGARYIPVMKVGQIRNGSFLFSFPSSSAIPAEVLPDLWKQEERIIDKSRFSLASLLTRMEYKRRCYFPYIPPVRGMIEEAAGQLPQLLRVTSANFPRSGLPFALVTLLLAITSSGTCASASVA